MQRPAFDVVQHVGAVMLQQSVSRAAALHEHLDALWSGDERTAIARALRRGRTDILARWAASQRDADRLRRYGVSAEERDPRLTEALLEVLRAWVRTGEARYADVYLDERLRGAPLDWKLRRGWFGELLEDDERALLAAVADPPLRPRLQELLVELHAPLRAPPPEHPLRLLTFGTCLVAGLRTALVSRCRNAGFALESRDLYLSPGPDGLSTHQAADVLREFPADFITVWFPTYRGIAPCATLMQEADVLSASEARARVDLTARVMRQFLERLRDVTDVPFLVHNASGMPISRMQRLLGIARSPLSEGRTRALRLVNEAIAEIVRDTPNSILLDEASVAATHGLRACSEPVVPPAVGRGWFRRSRLGEFLAPSYLDIFQAYRALSACKVIAVDFDNTLWDGVMAEGAVVQRRGLQHLLRRLKDAGILLVAVSKNDPAAIRWDETLLQPSDFVLQKVSWRHKAESIREAASQLGLSESAFVLLDDNPVERELVSRQLTRVKTLDPGAEHAERWLEWMLAFPNTRHTNEARQRTELYRQQVERRAALGDQLDHRGMMAGLQMRVRFGPMQARELERVAELVLRTNQFNTTTLRYGRQRIAELASGTSSAVYVATLTDKFGVVGLVAVAIVRRDGSDRIIDDFVMSCRAIGLGLESWVLRRVLDVEGGAGLRFLGRYVPTERNGPCARLFADAGFTEGDGGTWTLEASAPRPEAPPWFESE